MYSLKKTIISVWQLFKRSPNTTAFQSLPVNEMKYFCKDDDIFFGMSLPAYRSSSSVTFLSQPLGERMKNRFR